MPAQAVPHTTLICSTNQSRATACSFTRHNDGHIASPMNFAVAFALNPPCCSLFPDASHDESMIMFSLLSTRFGMSSFMSFSSPLLITRKQDAPLGQASHIQKCEDQSFGVPHSLTYVCVQQPLDKMSIMLSLIHQALICNTIQHPILVGHTKSKSHMCMQSLKIGQGLALQHTVGKNSAISHHFKPLCVLTQLRRSIYNSAVAKWTPHILVPSSVLHPASTNKS